MTMRMNYVSAAPDCFKAMMGVEQALHAALEPKLLHMLKLRASQINGCAYCIDMHWKDAKAAGETDQRLYGLDAWEESPYYTDKERAALGWTDALTKITEGHAPDDAFAAMRAQWSDKEIAVISWTIAAINAWNRMGIGFRATPGQYQPPKTANA